MNNFIKINICIIQPLTSLSTFKIEANETREITVRTKQIVPFVLREGSVEIMQEPIIIKIRFKITV